MKATYQRPFGGHPLKDVASSLHVCGGLVVEVVSRYSLIDV